MTGLFVKPCCRAGSVRFQSLSSAKDGLYFVPVIAARFWLLSLLMLVLFSSRPQFHPQFSPSPTPLFPAPS